MLFRKSDKPDKKNDPKLSLKRADVLITGVILGGIVASVYGIKKVREKGEIPQEQDARTDDAPKEKKKPNFFFRLYHAIRYGQDYQDDPRD
jgi:Na+/glutamate symporter